MKNDYFPPQYAEGEYHCPHCGVFAKQRWSHMNAPGRIYGGYLTGLTTFNDSMPKEWSISICEHCNHTCIWFSDKLIYPKIMMVMSPNDDLNEEIKIDYLEAANIFSDSPRAAAALLRLALQKLCIQLGEKGENINDDIGELVKKGLNPTIQKSLDALRITGNNAVHPGEINLNEEPAKVVKLFRLLNFIAEKMITEPKEINNFYENLPEGAKKAVEKRDNNKGQN